MACGLCAFRMENEDIKEQTCINSGWMPKPLGCSKLPPVYLCLLPAVFACASESMLHHSMI